MTLDTVDRFVPDAILLVSGNTQAIPQGIGNAARPVASSLPERLGHYSEFIMLGLDIENLGLQVTLGIGKLVLSLLPNIGL
jgi:hypothetical protein